MNYISVDWETYFSRKLKYSVRTMIVESYAAHPLFDAYMISVSDGKNNWAGHPRDFNWSSLEGATLLSHNARFDQVIYEEMVRRNLAPKINYAAWHCTANLSAFLCNRRALDQAVEYLFGVKLSKEARGNSEGKHWPQDFSSEEQKAMLEYARSDAYWCWNLWDKFSHRWPEHERELSRITMDQGKHGVQINTELLDTYIVQTHELKTNTEKVLPWMAAAEDEDDASWEEFNKKPTSTKCIAEACRRDGIPACPVKADDEEAYADWEALYAPSHPWIYAVSSWRSVNKLYKTFLKIKSRLRPDGTMPFSLKYFGAHTGRWSGAEGINMQNPRKRPVFCNERGLMEVDVMREDAALTERKKTGVWPGWVKFAVDFRHLIIPRPGKRMVVSDLSQIEPRVLAWLCGNKELLALMASGQSPYEAHARTTMGWVDPQPLKKAADNDPKAAETYKLAKARVLALGYQAGWEKFVVMALDVAGLDITKDDPEFIEVTCPITGKTKQVSGWGTTSKKIVAEFREQNPKIKALWEQLDSAFKRSVGSDFTMGLPSGRVMKYDKVRCEIRIEKDKETGKPKRRSVFTADIGGRRKIIYGGLLTENLTQAVARDVFAWHIVNMARRGWLNLFSAHDEAILEVDADVSAKDVEQEMSRCPEWILGLPVAAEAKAVPHYLK